MAMSDYDAVGRAARLIRAQSEPGWRAIEDDVIAAVQSTPRGGWPLLVEDPYPGSAIGALSVSDLVLGARLSRALAGDADYAVTNIDIQSENAALQRVSVELSGRYLADLSAATSRAAVRSQRVVADVIGDVAGVSIDVTVTDVHR